nr:uncharacterized protein LOC106731327 isoform X2 [Pelodiscus sinensis]|eukprot:XP_014424202.1 uncharacterized protein LOC106731327 isoform X2 [Pelodiscus sinensis]
MVTAVSADAFIFVEQMVETCSEGMWSSVLPDDSRGRLSEATITADDQVLENVNRFPYLGSYLPSNAGITMKSASAGIASGGLRRQVFADHDIKTQTKIDIYNVVIPMLLYGTEVWTPYRRQICLEKFHQRYLRRILGITWQDRRTNISVLTVAHSCSIEASKEEFLLTSRDPRERESMLPLLR